MCSETLQLENLTDVKLTRLGDKRANHTRPIKVVFKQNWEKRKFLSRLYRLKVDEKFKNINVSHDMNEEERVENKKLLKEAYEMNINENNQNFKYKVRGPPWAMKIVKVFPKN